MKKEISATRKIWILTFRAFRIAHNQISIMSEDGIAVRLQATSEMRKLTNRWDLPTLNTNGFLNRKYKKTFHRDFRASNALNRFLKSA